MVIDEETYKNLNGKLLSGKSLLDLIKVKKDFIILNAGCGYNPQSILFADKVKSIMAFDIDEEKVKIAKKIIKERGIKNVKTFSADIRDLTITQESVDTVLAIDILEHVDKLEISLREIYRVLKKDGKAIISIPLMEEKYTKLFNYLYKLKNKKLLKNDWSEENYKRSKKEYFNAIKNTGFKIKKTRASTLFPPLHWLGIKRFWFTNKIIYRLDRFLCLLPFIKYFGPSLRILIERKNV